MSINSNSRFTVAPIVNIERSTFPMGQKVMTTLNAGDLVPLFQMEVLPGDTLQLTYNTVCRMMTPIYPVMDVAVFEYFAFFTPNRQLWNHWVNFTGENTEGPWVAETTYTVPRIIYQTGYVVTKDTVAGHLGVPLEKTRFWISALPVRNYCHIWNNYFRDQNVMAPIDFGENSDSDVNYNYNDAATGGKLLKVSKKHDYFTSALLAPQRGPEIKIPVQNAIVKTQNTGYNNNLLNNNAMLLGQATNGGKYSAPHPLGIDTFGQLRTSSDSFTTQANDSGWKPMNLFADVQDAIGTINALRLNVAIQNWEVKKALYGERYFEQLKGQWGVDHVGNLVMMRPEFLGSRTIPITMEQVPQYSETTNTSPQGNIAAYSLTSDLGNQLFHKSFTEHGWIMIVGCVRQLYHSYQQGLNRMWRRRTIYDFYNPVFRHLSEQPIYNREIYMEGGTIGHDIDDPTEQDNEVFGYQERWAEYRYLPNCITGELNSKYSPDHINFTPLDQWHYGDKYDTLPVLSQSFIEETKDNIERTLAVQNHDQFILDGFIQIKATRPMPLYSMGAYMDHL